VASKLKRGLELFRRRKVLKLAGHRVEMPASHQLPAIRRKYPHYEGEIARLAEFLNNTEGRLAMIDVGANVGDTVALIQPKQRAQFLCIEGSPEFFRYLQRNVRPFDNVRCINALVTDSSDLSQNSGLVEADGTAHVAQRTFSKSAANVPRLTLDRILSQTTGFPAPNFLKIDTDGYELKVLRSGINVLQNSRPAIHFELSFRHWKNVGGATWREAADLLVAHGYKECLLYDNFGYLVAVDQFADGRVLPVMESYAFRRDQFYLNVITFHCSSPHWTAFKQNELDRPFDS
jgi:FkbM family methyltransferase